ncbi:MAG: pyroglutamyl-peptidase I [Candidatus Thermoplasmatota archaeon]|nr:pyroglutamyl-peptidase I [Candidatus Thermoplasmatota archaeon]
MIPRSIGAEALSGKKVLLTGFGPFDIFPMNPSGALAEALSKEFGSRWEILPVVFGSSRRLLMEILDGYRPDLVISFGLNGGISHIALEKIALNVRYSEIPENEGKLSDPSPIVEGGPLAYGSGLPLDRILLRMRASGIPSRMSFSAGTYICNEVFYTVMEHCSENAVKGGFIHVPMASDMIAGIPRLMSGPHMGMSTMIEAGRIALSESLR